SLPALLDKLDGYHTKDAERPFTLHLAGAQIDYAKPGFFTRLLNTLIDPNLLSLLFLAGIAGIGFEIFHPGVVLPGALGGIALLTALFGLSVTIALGLLWAFALAKAVQVRRRPPSVVPLRVVGADAVVRAAGQVFVEGELWHAHRSDGRDLVPGEHVRVEGVEGLELTVE